MGNVSDACVRLVVMEVDGERREIAHHSRPSVDIWLLGQVFMLKISGGINLAFMNSQFTINVKTNVK